MEKNYQGIDPKELDFADTLFIRDIDSRVFQSIAFKCLEGIEGVTLAGGNLIDALLGRETPERVKGIAVEQDQKNHSVHIKVELNIAYGISIPEKAEEVQTKIVQEVTRLSGLHVACVHVVFKNLIVPPSISAPALEEQPLSEEDIDRVLEKKQPSYSDEF